MAQADSGAARTKAFCHAQGGPSDAPQERVHCLRKSTHNVSQVDYYVHSF